MDPRGLPTFQYPRVTWMGQKDIGSVPASIPINVPMGNPTQGGTMGPMQGAPLADNHGTTFTHKTHLNKMPVQQQHYTQLPLRKEVDDEGRICGVVLPQTTAHLTTEENNVEPVEFLQETIKTEEEEDISNFMETAYDTFLKISSKELRIKEASNLLGRPYSFVYSRYQEFCDKVTGSTGKVTIKKKKKGARSKRNGKKKRKSNRLTTNKGSRRSGKIYQCEECPAIFHTEYLINIHAKVHTEGNESHTCTACGIVFPKLQKLMSHRIEFHEEALQCPHCDKQFTIIASYKFHLKKHTRVKPFVCNECGKGFFSRFNLEGHHRQHTGERPFMCGYCEKTFTTLNILKAHQYVHTGRASQPKNFECKECGQKYISNLDLEQHMNTHTGAKPYACDQCDERFNFKANLTRHKMKHTGEQPYKCDLCPAAFCVPVHLKRHKISHSGLKPFKCELCDFSCTRKQTLEYHGNTHTGETPFKCDFYGCTAEYARPNSLKHHKLSHGPPPPQSCKVCNERLPDSVSLKRHMMIHTGEKPQTCDQCFKVFYEKSSLKRHMYTHMYKPPGSKTKQVRQSRKNPVVKRASKPVIPQMLSEYQAPVVAAENGHSSLAQSWTINAEDIISNQSSQPSFHPFTASQYSNLVNNAWPSTMDPDELRRRLLSSFK